MATTVTLYTTAGCHLCELAAGILQQLQGALQFQVEPVDIADSDELVDRYGIRIPVIRVDTDELGWPFSLEEASDFLQRNGASQ